jgi:hypothetical protein
MALKPWYTVVTPRADLREGRPLDAAEFAVHLDKVRDGSAGPDYDDPKRFFERTYLTQTLLTLGSETIRRLSGEVTETSASFNMMTQFGGGKTHALALLYHLARHGSVAASWPGVSDLLSRARVPSVPAAATAVFVGTEFDSLTGRGGNDGTPRRYTPWGELAFQLGESSGRDGATNFGFVAEHDAQRTAPAGDVIRQFIPDDRPTLIVMDELMNYISRNRKSGLGEQFFHFMQNLTETARGLRHVVVAISLPASELEMTPEDFSDLNRFSKVLDRLSKAIMMASDNETAEIIRRRLFEWDASAVNAGGRVLLPRDALATCDAYATWAQTHRAQLPGEFPVDNAKDVFAASYPFHPALLSVFERKWRTLPRFQQTRGVLRMLALWVAHVFSSGYVKNSRDPLIDLGSAPLDDSLFRAAAFEQLGDERLEAPVTTDIIGRKDSHAVTLDSEAAEDIKKARLHRRVATTIFFESNGGQAQTYATLPEIRLAVGAPDVNLAQVETALDALVPPNGECYYLDTNRNRYWFSTKPNLTKLLADRKASVPPTQIEQRVQDEIEKVFVKVEGVERSFFPATSNQISNVPAITLVIMAPDQRPEEYATTSRIESFIRDYGSGSRTYKSALIFVLAASDTALREESRKLLAWEAIGDERDDIALDDSQKRQIDQSITSARRDLREAVWRAYHHIALLDTNNTVQVRDLGLVHSSSASSLTQFIINQLKLSDDIQDTLSPRFLLRNWPAMSEWSTKSVRDACFASPKFPRLLSSNGIKETIARGVSDGMLAYVGKTSASTYEPFFFNQSLTATQIELSEDAFIITRETAERYLKQREEVNRQEAELATERITQPLPDSEETSTDNSGVAGVTRPTPTDGASTSTATPAPTTTTTTTPRTRPSIRKAIWHGDITRQKWTTFYTKVLSQFAQVDGVKISVRVEVAPDAGLLPHQVEEMKTGLRDLGLDDSVDTE